MTPVASFARLVACNLAIFVAAVAAYGLLRKVGTDSPLPLIAGGAVAFAASIYLIRHGASGPYSGLLSVVGGVCVAAVVYFGSVAAVLDLWGLGTFHLASRTAVVEP